MVSPVLRLILKNTHFLSSLSVFSCQIAHYKRRVQPNICKQLDKYSQLETSEQSSHVFRQLPFMNDFMNGQTPPALKAWQSFMESTHGPSNIRGIFARVCARTSPIINLRVWLGYAMLLTVAFKCVEQ